MTTSLLDIILDSWDRNNTILVNLLRAVPQDLLTVRATPDSPTVAGMFTHVHYCRMIFLSEDAPEFGRDVPSEEWKGERDPDRMAVWLNQSAKAVRDAVEDRLQTGKEMIEHYDNPVLFLQHMIWHEGYHHGQIKLALKLAGHAFDDEKIGPVTWDVWMEKTGR